ncbi:hypothetical protein [Herminiimonas aquatilis]|uniref:Uncharacterized protein n=1 Tax=Herminiimonas aquatilis TaxID=345342 RepID=A0ABW2J4T9_9BURK
MEKVAPETAFLPKVAVNIADLNQGQFKHGNRPRCVGIIQRSASVLFNSK